MREAIGGTWIFQIVIFFILLFTGFMCLSINHSKAFNVKDMIVKEIERQEGINLSNPESDEAIQNIVKYLKETSYRTTGTCPSDYIGYNRDGQLDSRNSAFCLRAVSKERVSQFGNELPIMTYYQIVVFYQLDLPIFSAVFNFRVSGDTRIISHSGRVNR